MCEFKNTIQEFVKAGKDMVCNFSVEDITLFKVCVMAFGMLVAIYSHKTCKKLAPLIWILFIATFAYLIGNYFFLLRDQKEET